MLEETSYQLSPTERFWRLLKPDQREIRNVYVYAVFNGLVNLSLPVGIQAIVNLIQGGQVSTSWIVLVCFVIGGVAITGVLYVFQLRITENLQQKIFSRAAFEFAYRIPRIKMEALYKHHAPELMNRFFDTISVQKGLSKILIDFSGAALQTIFGLILLSLYHPLFIAFSLILIVLVYAIFQFTARRGLRTSLKESKHKYEVAHWLEEVARTATTFKLAGKTDLPLEKVDKYVGDYLEARENHFKVLVQQYSLLIVFKVLIATGLLAIGGMLVIEQRMNIGQFIAAELIILMVMSSVEKMILSLETIYDVLTSLEKIGQVTDLELEHNKGMSFEPKTPKTGLAVDLENICFSYPDMNSNTLNKLNLSVKPGEHLVLMGSSGSGKSTLLNIIAGLYKIDSGSISFDGIPINNLDLNELRTEIGDCLSQEQLFEGTVLQNITMGREAATMDNVKWAVEKLGLNAYIRSLSEGYDTILLPGGKRLPKSISQKLIMARAIVDKPRLLMLEHFFENIELTERATLIDFITDKSNPWTIIAVSANPTFARQCHRVALLADGKIAHSGSYDEVKKYLTEKE
jgi:ABC-type bacteriocin/lantibiotic exporter with double-glycine peptidase domain